MQLAARQSNSQFGLHINTLWPIDVPLVFGSGAGWVSWRDSMVQQGARFGLAGAVTDSNRTA